MAMGGDGPGAITVMWVMVALTALCVSLRLYVRMFLVANTGYDDHVYILAFVSIPTYWTTYMHFSDSLSLSLSFYSISAAAGRFKH